MTIEELKKLAEDRVMNPGWGGKDSVAEALLDALAVVEAVEAYDKSNRTRWARLAKALDAFHERYPK